MRTLFLINPRSGPKRNPQAIRLAIERLMESDWTVRDCGSLAALDAEIDAAHANGIEVLCAVGGDGTVREIGKRLIGRSPALAIIPTGSGNGLARHLRIPLDPASAVAALRTGSITEIDTAEANGIPFLGVCGIGFDAAIAHRFASSTVRGMRTYVRVGFHVWMESREEPYLLEIDGTVRRVEALIVAVANSSQYGNDAKIAPLASLRDGALDIVIARNPPFWGIPFAMRQLFSGSIHRSPHVTIVRGSSVTIERPSEGPVHLDGEPLVLPSLIRFSVRPRSLRVVVPAGVDNV